MNQIRIWLNTATVLSIVTNCFLVAAPIQQAIQYNREATQALQNKLNTIQTEEDIANNQILSSIDQLITQGADPNLAPKSNPEQPLVILLFTLPAQISNNKNSLINEPMIEKIIKNALANGAHMNLDAQKSSQLLTFIMSTAESPSFMQLAIDYGASVSLKMESGDTPLMVAEKTIALNKDTLKRIQDIDIPMLQKSTLRFEKIRDILKAAEQKK